MPDPEEEAEEDADFAPLFGALPGLLELFPLDFAAPAFAPPFSADLGPDPPLPDMGGGVTDVRRSFGPQSGMLPYRPSKTL